MTPEGPAGPVSAVSVRFNEPIDEVAIPRGVLRLQAAGLDYELGTPDDFFVDGGTVSFRSEINTLFLAFEMALPNGRYLAGLDAAVSDLAGNGLAADME